MVTVMASSAQTPTGSWTTFTEFALVEKIVDTPARVYFTSSGQLFHYDKKADETFAYTPAGLLNGACVSQLYYDRTSGSLAVVYDDASIDLLDTDGNVTFLPDIRDAQLSLVPAVNDVAFTGNVMTVATNFGVVQYDVDRREVITAGNYGIDVNTVATTPTQVWMGCNYNELRLATMGDRLTNISALPVALYFTNDKVKMIDDQHAIVTEPYIPLYILKLGDKDGGTSVVKEMAATGLREPQQLAGGGVLCRDNTRLLHVGTNLTITARNIPTALRDAVFTASSGLDSVWVGNGDGISLYDFTTTTPRLVTGPIQPMDAIAMQAIGRFDHAADGTIYVAPYGQGNFHSTFALWSKKPFPIYALSPDGSFEDVSPTEYTTDNKNMIYTPGKLHGFYGGHEVKAWPGHPGHYAVGNRWDGVYIFDHDGKEVAHYHTNNSTLKSILNGYCTPGMGVDFDSRGNLWVGQEVNTVGDPVLHCLTAAKVGTGTTAADWQSLPSQTTHSMQEAQVLASRRHNVVYYKSALWDGPLVVDKTRGTDTLDDDELLYVTTFIDQDGKTCSFNIIGHMHEDPRGRLWLGTNNGVYIIADPSAIEGSTARVTHIKVPRNDGTNFADYLMDGQHVLWIATDAVGNHWLASNDSGLYYVSADGDKILDHFTTDNSPLPTNTVCAVTCGRDNKVYVGTRYGLQCYNSTTTAGAPDYDGLHAFPNPVRPEYQGWVTVKGLMENSLVKITDAGGRLVSQGTSNGGMYMWDVCDMQGRRVPTGVYYVMASTSGDGSGAGVTKILVVN